jgi:hypothetical protein
MAAVDQASINRTNAAKSTGPKTREGKAKSSKNAIKHGIKSEIPVIPGVESFDEWEDHRDAVVRGLHARGELEIALAERASLLMWRMNRVIRFENETAAREIDHASQTLDTLFKLPVLARSKTEAIHVETAKKHFQVCSERYDKYGARALDDPDIRDDRVEIGKGIKDIQKRAILPPVDTLQVIVRYEAHLQRALKFTLQELVRVQKLRESIPYEFVDDDLLNDASGDRFSSAYDEGDFDIDDPRPVHEPRRHVEERDRANSERDETAKTTVIRDKSIDRIDRRFVDVVPPQDQASNVSNLSENFEITIVDTVAPRIDAGFFASRIAFVSSLYGATASSADSIASAVADVSSVHAASDREDRPHSDEHRLSREGERACLIAVATGVAENRAAFEDVNDRFATVVTVPSARQIHDSLLCYDSTRVFFLNVSASREIVGVDEREVAVEFSRDLSGDRVEFSRDSSGDRSVDRDRASFGDLHFDDEPSSSGETESDDALDRRLIEALGDSVRPGPWVPRDRLSPSSRAIV